MPHRQLVTALFTSALAGCALNGTSPGVVYYVPVVPLAAFPAAPFPVYAVPVDVSPPAEVVFETPSLAVRALAMRISESASNADCRTALRAGDELEKLDHTSHHALLAIDERYASCVRGF